MKCWSARCLLLAGGLVIVSIGEMEGEGERSTASGEFLFQRAKYRVLFLGYAEAPIREDLPDQ